MLDVGCLMGVFTANLIPYFTILMMYSQLGITQLTVFVFFVLKIKTLLISFL